VGAVYGPPPPGHLIGGPVQLPKPNTEELQYLAAILEVLERLAPPAAPEPPAAKSAIAAPVKRAARKP
jgi:hypothetical protein